MATSPGRYPARDRDETGQTGVISSEGLLQQQVETTAGKLEATGFFAPRSGSRRVQEETFEVLN